MARNAIPGFETYISLKWFQWVPFHFRSHSVYEYFFKMICEWFYSRISNSRIGSSCEWFLCQLNDSTWTLMQINDEYSHDLHISSCMLSNNNRVNKNFTNRILQFDNDAIFNSRWTSAHFFAFLKKKFKTDNEANLLFIISFFFLQYRCTYFPIKYIMMMTFYIMNFFVSIFHS